MKNTLENNSSIKDILNETIIEKAYEITNEIKESLGLNSENFIIRDENDENILYDDCVSVQFTSRFITKSSVKRDDFVEKLISLGVPLGDICTERYSQEELEDGLQCFYLDIDSCIILTESVIENKQRLQKVKGVIEYMKGLYSYGL